MKENVGKTSHQGTIKLFSLFYRFENVNFLPKEMESSHFPLTIELILHCALVPAPTLVPQISPSLLEAINFASFSLGISTSACPVSVNAHPVSPSTSSKLLGSNRSQGVFVCVCGGGSGVYDTQTKPSQNEISKVALLGVSGSSRDSDVEKCCG